jgi:hypothetical protein
LTADRAPDAPRGVPLPHTPQRHWRRPYRPGPWRVGIAALILLLASYILLSALIIALAGTPSGATATVAIAVLIIAFALRMLRIGVWVSPRGLRQVNLLTTSTVRWRDITRVSTVQQPVKWLGLPRSVQGQALLIERRRGGPMRTLLTDHNSDFLSRPEAFDRAADLIEAWAAQHR